MTEEVYAPIIDDTFTLKDALHQILRICTAHNTLRRGLRQSTKSLLRKRALLLIVHENVETRHKSILIGLAKMSNTPVIMVDTNLAELVALGRTTLSKIKKLPKCGAVCVEDFVTRSEGRVFVEQMLSRSE